MAKPECLRGPPRGRTLSSDPTSGMMDKIVRREFRGNWLLFWVLCLTVIGLPLALLYLLNGTVEIHSECKDAETAIEKIRTRR
jgi:hypothetical protein